MNLESWTALRDLGVAGLLAFALVGGWRRWYVWAWVLDDKGKELDVMTADRDFWRETALAALGHTDKAIDVVAKASRK